MINTHALMGANFQSGGPLRRWFDSGSTAANQMYGRLVSPYYWGRFENTNQHLSCFVFSNICLFPGVFMWEVYSEGRTPYDNRSNTEVVEDLNQGKRLQRPRLCPQSVYELMEWSWKEVREERKWSYQRNILSQQHHATLKLLEWLTLLYCEKRKNCNIPTYH